MNYFRRKASPWVSLSVLAGGLVSAIILFFLVRVESSAEDLSLSSLDQQVIVDFKK
jgi:hypothetical protein